LAKPKVISLQFLSVSDEPVGYLMVETDDEEFAKQIARRWGEKRLTKPFARVKVHQGVLDSPEQDPETFDEVQVWELPF
jgi:hypothetical protein